jgi:Ribosomal protein L4/L1 family
MISFGFDRHRLPSLCLVLPDMLSRAHRANLRLASGNLPWVDVLPAVGANVYSILQRDYLLMSQDAVAALSERSSRFIHRKPERLRSAAGEIAATSVGQH